MLTVTLTVLRVRARNACGTGSGLPRCAEGAREVGGIEIPETGRDPLQLEIRMLEQHPCVAPTRFVEQLRERGAFRAQLARQAATRQVQSRRHVLLRGIGSGHAGQRAAHAGRQARIGAACQAQFMLATLDGLLRGQRVRQRRPCAQEPCREANDVAGLSEPGARQSLAIGRVVGRLRPIEAQREVGGVVRAHRSRDTAHDPDQQGFDHEAAHGAQGVQFAQADHAGRAFDTPGDLHIALPRLEVALQQFQRVFAGVAGHGREAEEAMHRQLHAQAVLLTQRATAGKPHRVEDNLPPLHSRHARIGPACLRGLNGRS